MKFIDKLVSQFFKIDLRRRLIIGFLIATCLTGLIATLTGIWTINKSTIGEVQNRVRQDINTAKLIYNLSLEKMTSQIQFAAEAVDMHRTIISRDIGRMETLKGLIRHKPVTEFQEGEAFLDMLSIVDAQGRVLYRAANPNVNRDSMLWEPVVRKCIEEGSPQTSAELMPIDNILRENPELSARARTEIIRTPLSYESREKELSKGMVMMAAYPITDSAKRVIGAIIGGVLLNRDYAIVDKIKETVYLGEKYKGREMGVATIFQGGVRISTNVMTTDDKRAVGTMLSKEVYDRVIVEGKDWVGRAFVVNDWYITTYTPIYDIDKKLIGALYVGILEAKYRDIKWSTIWINLGITFLGMIIAFIISFWLGNTIITRIRMLKEAAESIAAGNLDYKLSPDRLSGFDMLDEAFNYMSKSLKNHNEMLYRAHQQLARTEKLTALGEMAAGVAHEINNPLGGILLYSNLVLEDIPADSPARENMQKIIYQTNRSKRIVQGLLDFARTPTGDMVPLKINSVIESSLGLVQDQAMFHGIEIKKQLAEDLPEVMGDKARLEDVFLNLFINAADAMKGGGTLTITTTPGVDNSIKILIADTGKGIEEKDFPHIFEPFFTTKDPGHGTGLGLPIAYGIIRKHNGFIDAESRPGKGATFIITLPAYIGKYSGLDVDSFMVDPDGGESRRK
ncbi:MAG TPA: cache domain-containing protein [Syntrophales bacterium]|nr:cache domain-containing protein [Syntrophales bacterium]